MNMNTSDLTGERIRQYLAEGKRFDGRKTDEFREIIIETGVSKNAEGSARVKMGKTEVLVGVKMDVGAPYPDSQDKGNLMVTSELLPLSSPRFEIGPPKIESIELARIIDRAIRESKMIELEKLCIKEGEKVWTVYIDLYSINDDGNLLDACGIGAIAALQNAKIPKYDEETEKVIFGEWTDKSVPLAKNIPVSITVHKIGESLIVDPTREEEDLSETRITIGSSDGVISSMQKGDSRELSIEEFNEILDLVEKVEKMSVIELHELVKTLEEKFGVSASAVATAPAAGATAPAGEDRASFDVELKDAGANKIAIIKVVKEALALGLAEAKGLVDGVPSVLKQGMPKADAEALKKKIEDAGGKVNLK